ncbi:MAG TPA: universal stress protein [Candidatus Dormibacteraeota bacterium]|nr:universal stress protein [Candidatus Dormibacteraeota bacterium]
MFRSILVAFDRSTHARAALADAADIARSSGASLTILSAWSAHLPWAAGAGLALSQDAFDELAAWARRGAEEALTEAVALLPDEVTARTVVAEGRPVDTIIQESTAGNHDLVVMGSRGLGDAASLVLGSVSHGVLHRSRVPVLIVPVAAIEDL